MAPIPKDDLPLLGGLLRLAHQEMLNEIGRGLQAANFGDISPAQYAVCQQLGASPEGTRLTALAAYAGMTKPSMSALVDGLERAGYVERVPDPLDGRAQLVRYTDRGWAFAEAAFQEVRRVEQAWSQRISASEVETLRAILRRLVGTRPTGHETEAPAHLA
jgi:DNA-binding MarR family transcriptional regulator